MIHSKRYRAWQLWFTVAPGNGVRVQALAAAAAAAATTIIAIVGHYRLLFETNQLLGFMGILLISKLPVHVPDLKMKMDF